MISSNPVPASRGGVHPVNSRLSRGLAFSLIALALLFPDASHAGEKPPLHFSHTLSIDRTSSRPMPPLLAAGVPETLNVLVAMVQFPVDNEPRTTGTGRFDL